MDCKRLNSSNIPLTSYQSFEQTPLYIDFEDDTHSKPMEKIGHIATNIANFRNERTKVGINTRQEMRGAKGEEVVSRAMECEPLLPSSTFPPGHLSTLRAIFMISNAALGAGLLNFPEAYMKAGGIHVALSIQFIMLIFIIGAFSILSRCADKYQAPTYQDLVRHLLGNRATQFVQMCIVVYFFGCCITYVIIIGEQVSSVIQLVLGVSGTWYTNQKLLMVVYAVIVLLPLCVQRHLKLLSYTSCFGGLGAIFITATIVRNYYADEYQPHPHSQPMQSDWTNAFAALPCLCFGFQCHVSSVVVYSEMKNRSRMRFFACAVFAMMVCATAYSLCGGYGYSTFGAQTNPDILTNYSRSDMLVNMARVCVLLILLTSFSIIVFCARNVIIDASWKFCKPGSELVRRVSITVTWFLCVLVMALVFPNISVAIGIVSGIAALFIFVFPGLCLFKSVNLEKDLFEPKELFVVGVALAYVMIGCFIFGLVTVIAIQQALKIVHT